MLQPQHLRVTCLQVIIVLSSAHTVTDKPCFRSQTLDEFTTANESRISGTNVDKITLITQHFERFGGFQHPETITNI